MATHQIHGVWGGTSEEERQLLRSQGPDGTRTGLRQARLLAQVMARLTRLNIYPGWRMSSPPGSSRNWSSLGDGVPSRFAWIRSRISRAPILRSAQAARDGQVGSTPGLCRRPADP